MAKIKRIELYKGYKDVIVKKTKWDGKKVIVLKLTENIEFQSLETVRPI